jgi:hypothetical protein
LTSVKRGWWWCVAVASVLACSPSPRNFSNDAGGGDEPASGAAGSATGDPGVAGSRAGNAGQSGVSAEGGAGASEPACDTPGGCSECEAGARCAEQVVENCVDGRWVAGSRCSGQTPSCVAGACAACEPGARRCQDDANPELCNEKGHWEPEETCPAATPVCRSGICVTCPAGSTRCTDNAPQTCTPDGATWTTGSTCSGDEPACIAATATCGRCMQNTKQCDGVTPQLCNVQGAWIAQAKCGGAYPECLGGTCVQCDPAKGNGRRCGSEGTPQVCSPEGVWQDETACSGATPICREETGRCACLDDSTRCLSGTPQRCVSGAWVNQPACTGDHPLCLGNGTCGCANDDVRCLNGSTPQRCEGNAWKTQTSCSGEAPVCSAGTCVCSEGAERCSGGNARQRCTDGSWQSTSACTGDTPVCHGAGVCGCDPGATRCDSPQVVASCGPTYEWSLNTCSAYRACNGQHCLSGPSVAGYIACDANEICDVGEQCCYDAKQAEGACQIQAPFGATCGRTGDEFELDCDGPSDCSNGQICCNTAYMRFTTFCVEASQCTGIGTSVVCNPDQGAQNNPSCAGGQTCQGTGQTAFPHLSVCK